MSGSSGVNSGVIALALPLPLSNLGFLFGSFPSGSEPPPFGSEPPPLGLSLG